MRLLVIEDDAAIARFLIRGLREEGHTVDHAADGEEGLFKAQESHYDCVVLDLSLPLKDGLSVLRELRSAGNQTPVLVLTARDAVSERVRGLDTGADDYLTKPFSFEELLARLRALLRRHVTTSRMIRVGLLQVDRPSRIVWFKKKRIDLSAREFALLDFLSQRPGEVVSRTRLFEHVWGEHIGPGSNTIDVHIKEIRRKLAEAGAEGVIETVRGAGYRLAAPPSDGK